MIWTIQKGKQKASPPEHQRVKIAIDFSKKALENTKDIDGEFVDIVNENFWGLIKTL